MLQPAWGAADTEPDATSAVSETSAMVTRRRKGDLRYEEETPRIDPPTGRHEAPAENHLPEGAVGSGAILLVPPLVPRANRY